MPNVIAINEPGITKDNKFIIFSMTDKKCKIEPCDIDVNDDQVVYHQPTIAKTVDDFALKLECK